jgi:PAS domain S-box-containing protein
MKINKEETVGHFRCKKCQKLLAKSSEDNFEFEIKCKKCGTFNSFLEKSEEQIIITDSKGKILFANEALSTKTMFSANEVIGSTPALWGGQMSEKFYNKMWKTILKEKKTFSAIVANKKKNGDSYEAKLKISPVMDANNEVKFLVGIETTL